MSDVAREAGVSKNTVSLALRGDPQIPAATTTRIRRICKRLGYRKDPTVAHLMARLRSSGNAGFRSPLALLNANADLHATRRHPTVPTYVAGCHRRATELGYTVDEFWLHDPGLSAAALNRIFRARSISGAVIVGLMRENVLPPQFDEVWEKFPAIVTGVRPRQPALSFACVDHHMLTYRAVEESLRLGYQRPALVLDGTIDELVNRRFTAGFLTAQRDFLRRGRTRPFLEVDRARDDLTSFQRWFERERPDVILTLYHEVRSWLTEIGLSVPGDLGLVQLEWRADHSDWAGMNQRNDIAGAAAVDMLVGLIHSGQTSIPEFPVGTLVGSSWVAGDTVKPC